MDIFENRLSTFTNWPYSGRLASLHMAAAGFYKHVETSDAVSCFCCEVRMEGWHQQSDPIEEHQRASPNCSWNNGTYMTTLEERLGSFHTWPIEIKPLPISLAAAGFYHSNKNGDGVTCFSCKLALRDWKKDDDPIKLHAENASLNYPCQWILKVTSQPEQYLPPSPPATPPITETKRKPRRCEACHKTFPSGNKFHKHRREAHRLIRGRIGVPLKRPAVKRKGLTFMGKHRVSKAVRPRTRS
ncbi:Baculoviral IAP repeat-containing protein 5 [Lecanora helva]